MEISLDTDNFGRLVATLTDGDEAHAATASNVPAAGLDFIAALDEVRDTGYGECLWAEQGGEYRWMFRRDGERLTVAVMWSHGTVTGWQHVFRADTSFGEFSDSARTQIDRLGLRKASPRTIR